MAVGTTLLYKGDWCVHCLLCVTVQNKAVIFRRLHSRCCHVGSYFKHVILLSLYTCGHYVQTRCHRYSRSSLQPSSPWLQEAVPSIRCLQWVFLRSLPQPGGDIEQTQLMCKYDVIHKTINMYATVVQIGGGTFKMWAVRLIMLLLLLLPSL